MYPVKVFSMQCPNWLAHAFCLNLNTFCFGNLLQSLWWTVLPSHNPLKNFFFLLFFSIAFIFSLLPVYYTSIFFIYQLSFSLPIPREPSADWRPNPKSNNSTECSTVCMPSVEHFSVLLDRFGTFATDFRFLCVCCQLT